MVSPSSSAAVSLRPCVSTTPITTSSPCARSRCACASIAQFFRHLRRRRRKFSTSPVGRGRLFQQAIRIRTQGFVVHFALCPCSASSARLSSTIFTTGCPRKRASGLCVYSATSCATCSTGSWRAAATRGDLPCRGAGRQIIIIQPACRGRRQLNRNRGTRTGLAARSAATRACICASSSGLLAAGCFRPTPVDYKAYRRWRRAGHENSPRR